MAIFVSVIHAMGAIVNWRFLKSVVMVGAFCVVSIQSSPLVGKQNETRPEYDWPGFLGPKRNGKSDQSRILTDWAGGKLKTLWRIGLGNGYSNVATAGGRLFLLDAVGQQCRLRCLDEKSGGEIWKFSYEFEYKDLYGFDDGPRATPLIDNGRVYIFGVEGKLHCLNVEDGSLNWSVDTKQKFGVIQNFFGVGSSPAIYDNLLVVMVGGSLAADQALPDNQLDKISSNETAIVIFDSRTGEVVQKFGKDFASYSSPLIYRHQQTVLGLAWLRNQLIGFDIPSGKQLWSFPFRSKKYESVNAMTPVVQGTQIFLSESYGLGSIVLDVGGNQPKVVWRDENPRNQSMASHWNTPVLHQGKLYGCHGANRSGAEIRCVDWATGKVDWKRAGFARSSLTFVDDHLVVLDENGELLLVKANSDSFQLVSHYSDAEGNRLPLEYPCWSAPAISNDLLFVRGKNELICLKLLVD